MLSTQQKIQFSSYSGLYDIIVPKDNLLRKINDLIDFSFIHDELLEKYCHTNGRTAESPIKMFKYLLLKTIYNVSDVDVVERSRYDMSFKYFLEMTPEEDVINPSSLTKFRKLRLKDMDLLNLLINKTVSIALEKGIIKSKSIIVDATHTHSRSNPYTALEVLKERSKLLRKVIYQTDEGYKNNLPQKNESNDLDQELTYCKELQRILDQDQTISKIPAVKEKLNLLKESIEDTKEYYLLSKDDEARLGYKSVDSSFFGYKTHLAMTEERIVTAAVVTTGEKGDGPELPRLLEISQQNGMEVDTIIGDAAYSGKGNLELAKKQNIYIIAKLNPTVSQGCRKEGDHFNYNKDAGMFVCPFRQGCYKEGSKTKSYSITIKSELHKEQIVFQETEYYRDKSKERYKIEAKNSELKNVHGYGRADSYGIQNMEMQGALAIFTVNLKRILKLI